MVYRLHLDQADAVARALDANSIRFHNPGDQVKITGLTPNRRVLSGTVFARAGSGL